MKIFNKKKKILMTGGSGLLGHFWIKEIKDSYEIFIVANKRFFKIDGHKTINLDLFNLDEIIKFIIEYKIDIFINLAAISDVEKCEIDPESAFKVNQLIPKIIAKACNLTNTKLIHISTDHLFDDEKVLHTEIDKTTLINQYAKSKYAGECAVIDEYHKALIFRTNFFGNGPIYRNSFSDWIINSLVNHQSITLFNDVFFSPLLGSKVAKYAHQLLELEASGIYNLSADDSITKYEFGAYITENLNLSKKLIKRGFLKECNNLTSRPLCMGLSNKKASSILGEPIGTVKEHIDYLLQEVIY